MATDLSPLCDRPLGRAIALAEDRDARLVLAHVAENEEKDMALARMRRELPPAAAHAELLVRTGTPKQALPALVAERGSDLIVTGPSRHDRLGDYFLGSTVDQIVRRADVPVLVVRKRPLHPYRTLLVASDFSTCSRFALLAAAGLFPAARIHLVHAIQIPYKSWLRSDDVRKEISAQARQEMAEFTASPSLSSLQGRIETRIEEGEIATVIRQQLHETQADLLVLGTHGRSGFAHAMIGSAAESLLAVADSDVLIVREPTA